MIFSVNDGMSVKFFLAYSKYCHLAQFQSCITQSIVSDVTKKLTEKLTSRFEGVQKLEAATKPQKTTYPTKVDVSDIIRF